jgi:hypothetical protein
MSSTARAEFKSSHEFRSRIALHIVSLHVTLLRKRGGPIGDEDMKAATLSALATSASMSAVLLDASDSQAQVIHFSYDWPTMEESGRHLDWCASLASDCGQRAAYLYCRDVQGHQGLFTYSFGGDVHHTQLVNGDYCDGSCDTFSRIVCFDFNDRDPRHDGIAGDGESER